MTTKVVIIGGGFAGLAAAKALKNKEFEITLLDKMNHHLFQPLLYQVATASLPLSNISFPLREVFKSQTNVNVLMADVEIIQTNKKQVVTKDGEIFSYDYLLVATGASYSYFGHQEWQPYAPGLKNLLDGSHIRERLLTAFEKAERAVDPIESKRYLNFAIIGAGPTGVEMAGSIAELARCTLLHNFRKIKPQESKIYLIEGADQVLPSYPKKLAEKAKHNLEQLGVTVLLNTKVTGMNKRGFFVGDLFYDAPTMIWAAGNQATSLLETLRVPLDKQGRVIVNKDLSIPDQGEVFVVGDAACFKNEKGEILPGVAPVAIQEARYVANLIKNKIIPEKRKAFTYFDKGMIATIGRGRAVAYYKNMLFSGVFAWLMWGIIHIFYLINFKNRLLVMIQWIFLYFTANRPDRIIRHPIDE